MADTTAPRVEADVLLGSCARHDRDHADARQGREPRGDEEDRAPPELLEQRARHEDAERAAGTGEAGPDADRLGPFFRREHAGDGGQGAGHEERGAQAGEGAQADQRVRPSSRTPTAATRCRRWRYRRSAHRGARTGRPSRRRGAAARRAPARRRRRSTAVTTGWRRGWRRCSASRWRASTRRRRPSPGPCTSRPGSSLGARIGRGERGRGREGLLGHGLLLGDRPRGMRPGMDTLVKDGCCLRILSGGTLRLQVVVRPSPRRSVMTARTSTLPIASSPPIPAVRRPRADAVRNRARIVETASQVFAAPRRRRLLGGDRTGRGRRHRHALPALPDPRRPGGGGVPRSDRRARGAGRRAARIRRARRRTRHLAARATRPGRHLPRARRRGDAHDARPARTRPRPCESMRQAGAALLARAQAAGEVRDGVDIDDLVRMVQAVTLAAEESDDPGTAERLFGFVLDGVRAH